MAFTSFGFVPETGTFISADEGRQITLNSFTQASAHLTSDKHSVPFEGEDDLRAEEDDNSEDDEIVKGTGAYPVPLYQSQLEYTQNFVWNSATPVPRSGKKRPLYVRFHCWKIDLNA